MANFKLEQCSSTNTFIVGFGESFTPMVKQIYSFSDGLTGETICGTVRSIERISPTTYSAITQYDNCNECIIDIPRSANTEYEVCEICCDCGSTGSTINLLTPPHPVYTDGYGTPVTQLNMVVIGGPNGLNS
jgi:hypothetical protein